MKIHLMAVAAVLAIVTAPSLARAEAAQDIAALKAESAALEKQNEQLEQRLKKLEQKQAAQRQKQLEQEQTGARPAATSFMAADLPFLKGGPAGCAPLSLDGPLTFCGITIFGTVDAGLGWVSHGLPENGQNYEGQSLINKFTNHPYWGVAQNNLQQTTLGIKGEQELLPGISGVFMASTGINPQSGQLANMPGTLVSNQGLPRNAYSFSGDGGRGGQAFNDQLFAGLSSPEFGQLTFGRHRPFSVDLVNGYDPTGGAYSFSPIAFNGQFVQGLGATESARWDDSLKYRVTYGPVHIGAMYKFADGNSGCNYIGTLTTATSPKNTVQTCYSSQNDAYQFNLGGSYGALDIDAVGGVYHQAVVIAGGNSPLSASQLTSSVFTSNTGVVVNSTGNNVNTLQALMSDNVGFAIAAKYTWNQFKFFAGYAHDELQNPSNNVGIGAQNDQGGYILSTVNNDFYAHPKVLQTFWAGVRYVYNPQTDFIGAYYHVNQNQFGTAAQDATCGAVTQNAKAAQCSGTLDAGSAYVDYHFSKRFDVYGGMEVSAVTGGIAGGTVSTAGKLTALGFNYYTNFAPVVGARFTF